jgi:hypothetical protein
MLYHGHSIASFFGQCAIFHYKIATKALPKRKKTLIIELYRSLRSKSRAFGKGKNFYSFQKGVRGDP